jgi:hypothetical protein
MDPGSADRDSLQSEASWAILSTRRIAAVKRGLTLSSSILQFLLLGDYSLSNYHPAKHVVVLVVVVFPIHLVATRYRKAL